MAKPLLEIGVDYGETVRMFEAFGFAAKSHCLAAAFIAANLVKAQAQANIPKGRPFTVHNIIVEPRRRADGYGVVMDRKVKDVGNLSVRRATSAFAEGKLRSAVTRAAKVEKHVGKWLEFGTVFMRSRSWLFPAATSQEATYVQLLVQALERAQKEVGG